MQNKTALIIGAGPAGLTAAYELLKHSDIKPIIFEMSQDIGGISKTIVYKGNRIDIGGHRFFSKSTRVMDWWQTILPLQEKPALDDLLLGRTPPLAKTHQGADPEKTDLVLLIRQRLSRIFFLRSFFDYPISLKWDNFKNLGLLRVFRIGMAYLKIRLQPIGEEKSLEDFLINRFGVELYETFFKDYTEKVWGVPCAKIPADWGAQRIKGLSISKTIVHAIKSLFPKKDTSIDQKTTETSLIDQFLYPKLGPGQLWEEVARQVVAKGGEINFGYKASAIETENGLITSLTCTNQMDGSKITTTGDYLISTMPVQELIAAMPADSVPASVKEIASGLMYRDFITVGLLLKKLLLKNDTNLKTVNNLVPDNWIYIQEKEVKLGRLQIFNNWSPYLVAEKDNVWIGLEYFCREGDELWRKSDAEMIAFAIDELQKIDIIHRDDVLDGTIYRIPKTYPAYFGTYNRFSELRAFVDTIPNLFLVGRNGMHRYNNADHSMLTAMVAVENILQGQKGKENIWSVNTEEEYHEQK